MRNRVLLLAAIVTFPIGVGLGRAAIAQDQFAPSAPASMMGLGSMMRHMMGSSGMMGGMGLEHVLDSRHDAAGGMMQGCQGMMGGGSQRPNDQWRGDRNHPDDQR